MAGTKLDPKALGYAGATVAAACMLLTGIGGNFGIYTGAAEQMMRWHMFFSLSPLGIILGIVEAAVISFVCGYAFAWLYNRLA